MSQWMTLSFLSDFKILIILQLTLLFLASVVTLFYIWVSAFSASQVLNGEAATFDTDWYYTAL